MPQRARSTAMAATLAPVSRAVVADTLSGNSNERGIGQDKATVKIFDQLWTIDSSPTPRVLATSIAHTSTSKLC